MNETTELLMRQFNSKKVHAETHEVGGGDEIDVTKLKNIEDYVTIHGDFAGTWNGVEMTSVEPGLSSAFNALKADVATLGIFVCAAPYNAVGDGVADDTVAIQAAIDAAPAGATLFLKNHRLHGVLTVSKEIKFKGHTYINGNDTGSTPSKSILYFDTAQTNCISSTANISFEDVIVNGNNLIQTVGINVTSASLHLQNAAVQGFQTGVVVSNGYYCKFLNSYIGFCNKDASFSNCYNITMNGMSFAANNTGIELLAGSSLRIFGGSIERFTLNGIECKGGSSVDIFGTYFEGIQTTDGVGNCIYTENDASVVAIGCHVYLSTCCRFVDGRTPTRLRLYSKNNRFIYPTNTTTVKVYDVTQGLAGFSIDISGDNWDAAAGANVTYSTVTTANTNGAFGDYRISFPVNHPLYNRNVFTPNLIQPASKGIAAAPSDDGTIVFAFNKGFAGDDPCGIHTNYGFNSYRAVYQKGQWEKLGFRVPNQVNTSGATLTQLETELNTLKTNLRAAGVMI